MPSINPSAFVMGPAFIRYRDVGVLTPYTDVGVTLDDAVLRIQSEMWSPDNLSGLRGKVRGLDVSRMVGAEIEFTLGEIAGPKLALAIPGARYTAPVDTVKSSGHLDTTLSAATAAGASVVPATSASNGAVGDYVKVGAGATAEYRRITAIATNDITLDWPLLYAHASGEALEESDSDNRSLVEMPILRRQPATAYKEWSLVAESGKSGPNELVLPIGIATTDNADVTVGDDSVSGIRVTIAGRLDETDLDKSLYRLYSPA